MVVFILSLFRLGILFLGKFSPNNQNFQFELKVSTQTNLNMKNSMVMFIFSVFDQKYLFWETFVLKNQNCLLNLNFST